MSIKLTAICASALALTSFSPQQAAEHAKATKQIEAQISSLADNLNACLAEDINVHNYMHGVMYRAQGLKLKDKNSDGTIDMVGEAGTHYYQKTQKLSPERRALVYDIQNRAIKAIIEKGCEGIYYMPGASSQIQTASLN